MSDASPGPIPRPPAPTCSCRPPGPTCREGAGHRRRRRIIDLEDAVARRQGRRPDRSRDLVAGRPCLVRINGAKMSHAADVALWPSWHGVGRPAPQGRGAGRRRRGDDAPGRCGAVLPIVETARGLMAVAHTPPRGRRGCCWESSTTSPTSAPPFGRECCCCRCRSSSWRRPLRGSPRRSTAAAEHRPPRRPRGRRRPRQAFGSGAKMCIHPTRSPPSTGRSGHGGGSGVGPGRAGQRPPSPMGVFAFDGAMVDDPSPPSAGDTGGVAGGEIGALRPQTPTPARSPSAHHRPLHVRGRPVGP